MRIGYGVLLAVVIGLTGSACKDVLNKFEQKPHALGKTNEVVVISDASVWDSFVGDTALYYFEAPFPIMPQPEPLFDVRQFTPEDLASAPLRKELRTYVILANLNDTTSATTKMVQKDLGPEKLRHALEDPGYFSSVGEDKWASGQLLIYVFGRGLDQLAQNFVKAFPSIATKVNNHDMKQIDAATYITRQNVPIEKRIKEKFGVSLRIPGDYKIAIDKDNFLWVREDLNDAISGIAMMRFPYTSPDQLDHDGFIALRDEIGKKIEGSTPGSHMVTNFKDLPVYLYKKTLDGHYAVEGRGIWELSADFLGGPFVTYAVVDSNQILMIDTFVHAPGKTKRDYVQRMEHIISSLKF